jgi:hypothetical protein
VTKPSEAIPHRDRTVSVVVFARKSGVVAAVSNWPAAIADEGEGVDKQHCR